MLATAKRDTANFDSGYKVMTAFTLTAGTDAATVNLRQGSATGPIKYVVKAAAGATVHLDFSDGVRTTDGSTWYVNLSAGTTPEMAITGY